MKKILTLGAALVAAGMLVMAVGTTHQTASAQGPGPYYKNGTSAVGIFVAGFNAVDSVLFNGEVVMVDTTASTVQGGVKRVAIRRYLGVLSDRFRVIGIVADTRIAKSSQQGVGRVLIWGYHPAAYVGVSNAGAKAPIKVGAVAAAFSVADSVSEAVGYVIGGNAGTSTVNTGPRYTYRVFLTGIGGKIVGAL